jgi:holin-like protein
LLRGEAPRALAAAAGGLGQHLSLLFVPAGVGVMVHFSRLGDEWPAIVAALLVSTFVTLGVTGLLLCALLKRGKNQP